MTTSTFRLPVDICNRALQHVGSRRITAAEFAAPTTNKAAGEVAFCYDKLRQAELRRNTWVFATKQAMLRPISDDTLFLNPPQWVSTTYYQPGHIVADSTGMLWQAVEAFAHETPGSGTAFVPYFGPMSASEYDSTEGYFPGEIVYIQGAVAGLASIYVAQRQVADATADVPDTLETWSATVTYKAGDIVVYSALHYISLLDLNLNYTPGATTYALWLATTTYATGNKVIMPDGRIYTSLTNGNLNHQPYLTDATYWSVAVSPPYVQAWIQTTGGVASNAWRYYGDGVSLELKSRQIIYPLGSGPASNNLTRNAFPLPAGYLRTAPQQPKAGSVSYLGGPSTIGYADWEMDGQYIVSEGTYPIPFRFIADITDVSMMDPMFCEGLACRVAAEVCEALTQSTTKLASIAGMYKTFMGEARTINAIESGATEPPTDDYIQCRA